MARHSLIFFVRPYAFRRTTQIRHLSSTLAAVTTRSRICEDGDRSLYPGHVANDIDTGFGGESYWKQVSRGFVIFAFEVKWQILDERWRSE